jgi:uncharacterized membrane protein
VLILLVAALAPGILAAAWSAGFFWTWSFTVMPGLGAATPEAAIEAMRRVNEGIRTPGFAFVLFGPAVFAGLATAGAFGAGRRDVALTAGLATAVHGAGVLWVTIAFNLPLNDALAAAPVTPASAGDVWRGYAAPWTAWNHLRTAAATGTLLLMLLAALLLAWR